MTARNMSRTMRIHVIVIRSRSENMLSGTVIRAQLGDGRWVFPDQGIGTVLSRLAGVCTILATDRDQAKPSAVGMIGVMRTSETS